MFNYVQHIHLLHIMNIADIVDSLGVCSDLKLFDLSPKISHSMFHYRTAPNLQIVWIINLHILICQHARCDASYEMSLDYGAFFCEFSNTVVSLYHDLFLSRFSRKTIDMLHILLLHLTTFDLGSTPITIYYILRKKVNFVWTILIVRYYDWNFAS